MLSLNNWASLDKYVPLRLLLIMYLHENTKNKHTVMKTCYKRNENINRYVIIEMKDQSSF